ncbi:GrpB family protein [Amphibacillus sediminis]|uniref:GrpB family protein n=1 Tax=Amphibacillus sediminis TaxID=360185 RepID=UPI00278BC1A7|nr:GrpB family protein [Amphibacillus sediminis]
MRKVEVHTFNEGWLESYQEESKVLIEVFNSEIVAIEHIGSTSVKGMKAKPINDIMITVNDINRMADHG